MKESEDLRSRLGEEAPLMTKVDFFFNKERKHLYFQMALMLIGAMILVLIPFIIGKWLDRFKIITATVVDFNFSNSGGLIAIVSGITIAWYILVTYGRSRYIRNIAMNKTRMEILKKVDRKDINYVEKRSVGRYVEYISNEQQNISRMFNSDVVSIVEGIFVFAVIIILMLMTNLILAGIYILLLPLTYFAISRMVRAMKKHIVARQKAYVKMNSYLDDISSNYSLIKMYGGERYALKKFSEIDENLSKHYRHVLYTAGYVSPIERIVENLGFIIAGIVGVLLLNSNMITAGMFLTFISYTSMMGKPLSNFADGFGRLKDTSISFKRVCKFLTSDEDERHGDADASCSDGSISFNDVCYTSEGGKKVFDHMSFDIRYGEHVSIVGGSGSGKSSCADLMVAMQGAQSGIVTYGGRNVFDYEKNSLRRSISVIPSVPWVMTGTVMENIRVAAPEATDEDVMRVCRIIGFDRSIERMENGFDTIIGSGIGNMSLAEKQMLSLARLLLSDPKVVVFDDSFSGMDALTALKIKEKMAPFLEKRTVIIISDDAMDMVGADRILFINDGRVMTGTHEELASVPDYCRMIDNAI